MSQRLSFVERSKLLLGDTRLAVRSLARTPVFTVVAITALALGMGAYTAMFSVVNGIILRPLSFPEPDRLTMISVTDLESGSTGGSTSQPDVRTIQADARTIVVRLVLEQGVRPVGIGVALGLLLSFWGTRVLTALLYHVSPQDIATLTITTILLRGVASLAILMPACRASRVAPTEALRAEQSSSAGAAFESLVGC